MARLNLFVILSVLVLACYADSNYPTINQANLKKIFDGVKPYADLSNAFYSVKGLSLLGETLNAQSQTEICNFVKSKVDKNSAESIYYAVSLAGSVPNCALPTADYQAALTNAANGLNVPDLYFYTLTAQLLKQPVDAKKVSKNVLDGLKKDSSILNQGYSLHIASLLSEGQKTFFDTIEDILDQADEVDKKFLQYEGGVGTTSLVLEGIFELSEKLKQFPAKFDQQRLVKFVNYLTSKRHPTNIKSAYYLLRIAQRLSDNQFNVPVVLNRVSAIGVSLSQPNVVASLTNILGKPVKQVTFTLEAVSAKSQKANGPTLLAAKKPFTAKSSDGTTFELKLVDQAPSPDFYLVTVSAVPKSATPNANTKQFFLVQNTFEVKVTTQISLTDVNVGVSDRDQATPKLVKVEANTQLKEKLDADQQSKFYLRFAIKENSKNGLIEAHQTFVRFADVKTGREIIFLAQANTNKQYSAEVDFSTNAKNFRHNSGVYTVELFVSDPLVENPIKWRIGDVRIQFLEDNTVAPALDKASLYAKKPEIKHLFRLPDSTPPAIVSTVFTALCLAPFVLLLLLWVNIGFNVSKMQVSLWSLLFHVSLAGIFGLYYCYWVKLNMFTTLKYLMIIGGVALVSGNKLLKNLAASKEKTN